jgi:hypothetical protein
MLPKSGNGSASESADDELEDWYEDEEQGAEEPF